jgi:hypothetical protein
MDLVRLGGCKQFKAFQKIYYCPHCIASGFAIAIYGYTKPENAGHFYFTRLDQADVLARLEYLEDEDLLFAVCPRTVHPGQVHNALRKYRDMFREDPEHAFHVLSRQDMKAIRFIFAYAHNFNLEEAREKRTQEALKQHHHTVNECPFPEHFRKLELDPVKTVITCKSGHRNLFVYAVVPAFMLLASMASGVPELITIGLLVAVCAYAYIALKMTACTELIVENGEIRMEQKSMIPTVSNVCLQRVTDIVLCGQYKGLKNGRIIEIPPDVAQSGCSSRKPVLEGLLFVDGSQQTFVPLQGTYEKLTWIRNAILEVAKAQGIYRT